MDVNIEINEETTKRKDCSDGNNKKTFLEPKILILSLLVIIIISCSGCFDNSFFSPKTTYESSPVKVSYQISYGYNITLTGEGIATINYKEFLPGSELGTVFFLRLRPENIVENQDNDNHVVIWNETMEANTNQSFSVSANIIQEPILISDLTGSKSSTLQEIHLLYPDLTEQYCRPIGNDTETIIDPNHPTIKNVAHTIKNNSKNENAFLVGKHLFSWLKNHTTYEKHIVSHPQPAIETYNTGVGDCDDLTYLYLSMCKAIGLPSRYVKGYLVSNNTAVAHVWAELFVGKQITETGWMPVECAGTGSYDTMIHHHYGLQDANHLRLCVDDGTNETFSSLNNPITIRYEPSVSVSIDRFELIENYMILSSKQLIIEGSTRSFE